MEINKYIYKYIQKHLFMVLTDNILETVLRLEQASSVAMTAQGLRSWQATRLGVALQTERTTGALLRTRNPLAFLDSPTGSMTSSASTTAACGPTTVTTTSNTGLPVTAGVTRHPNQVSYRSRVTDYFLFFSVLSSICHAPFQLWCSEIPIS